MKPEAWPVGVCSLALSLLGCATNRESHGAPNYQRFVLVQLEQPMNGCNPEYGVTPCATVVLALDTKTGQVCRAATQHGANYPLCLRLYESYPDNIAEVERLKEQISADKSGDWDVRHEGAVLPCPSNDPLGLSSPKPCQPLPSKTGEPK